MKKQICTGYGSALEGVGPIFVEVDVPELPELRYTVEEDLLLLLPPGSENDEALQTLWLAAFPEEITEEVNEEEREIEELSKMMCVVDPRTSLGETVPESDVRELERLFALVDPRPNINSSKPSGIPSF
jgi:hypothetical protein